MLQINAKENAVIEVVDGHFPLGQRNTIKIDILDDAIKSQIKPLYTGNCDAENNLYSYGDFSDYTDIAYVDQSHAPVNSTVNIIDGYGKDYSRCLHYVTTDNNDGFIKLSPDTNIVKDSKYVFASYVKVSKGKTTISSDYFNYDITSDNEDWTFIREEFTAFSSDFSVKITNDLESECYIDTVKLFLAENEIVLSDNYKAAIEILNPCYSCKNKFFDKEIKWVFDKGNITVYLYMDEVTVVDFQDNIICKLFIYQNVPHVLEYLGDYTYNKEFDIIYDSEEFVLNGYIIPDSSSGESKNSVVIRNKDAISATLKTAKTVATDYIDNNYNRKPTNYDGLFITLTDLNNIKVLYTYVDTNWLADIENYLELFVATIKQNFNDAEKQQARNNIGAISSADAQNQIDISINKLLDNAVIISGGKAETV